MTRTLAEFMKKLATMRKPRIKRCADGRFEWQCTSLGHIGYGPTPSSAYYSWRIARDADLWKREFAKPERQPWPRPPFDITCSTAH